MMLVGGVIKASLRECCLTCDLSFLRTEDFGNRRLFCALTDTWVCDVDRPCENYTPDRKVLVILNGR